MWQRDLRIHTESHLYITWLLYGLPQSGKGYLQPLSPPTVCYVSFNKLANKVHIVSRSLKTRTRCQWIKVTRIYFGEQQDDWAGWLGCCSNEPHHLIINCRWFSNYIFIYLSNRGFIVFARDNQGLAQSEAQPEYRTSAWKSCWHYFVDTYFTCYCSYISHISLDCVGKLWHVMWHSYP